MKFCCVEERSWGIAIFAIVYEDKQDDLNCSIPSVERTSLHSYLLSHVRKQPIRSARRLELRERSAAVRVRRSSLPLCDLTAPRRGHVQLHVAQPNDLELQGRRTAQ